jgi:hypothetical protein
LVADHSVMGNTYAVSWKHFEGRVDSGRLVLGRKSHGRRNGERLGGQTTVLLNRVNGRPIWIASVAQHAALLELHDGLRTRTSSQ